METVPLEIEGSLYHRLIGRRREHSGSGRLGVSGRTIVYDLRGWACPSVDGISIPIWWGKPLPWMGHLLTGNHPFIDGNKRIDHAAMEITLLLDGYEIDADVDE
uniref:Death on curing protein n=1 Tax=Candidatus Kentrum sp. LFY TaxID=2126342 RepID=A0A450V9T2_9GAMM|nr:MAG: death on curing protein [Candidatus Kentron sp. LFY]